MKKHNFNAGPSILPREVIEKAAAAVLDFDGLGLSILEISHRSKEFDAVMDDAVALFRELMNIPENYKVIFVGGGASTQFFHIPYNLLETKAGYINTGVWSKKAIKEAKNFGEVAVLASSEDRNFTYIPKNVEIPTDLDYLHITTNNTIYGTEYHTDIDCPVNLIADMSSDILSRPVDVTKYAMIYGGAQKNLGPAGATFAIIREDIVGKVSRTLPAMVDYRSHMNNNSMYNTPPVFPVYVIRETLKWIKSIGGVEEIYRRNKEKADLLYAEIDRNPMFRGTAEKEDRSLMNICFVMNPEYEALAPEFMEFAKARGMVGIKGHRLVGGFRASCYNALPKESVEALVATMQEFEKLHVK
ncbi:MAG: 3-phosphoserine/phosphohydroxythreonine transaminase [Rikenellaceae bacterium]|jgi:phosphoserine aminotransferase|nr:3-phosphoserine/phosphohydroxythreonine transaminase [Alistipes sp.]MBQ1991106.1 3-phosphoserine/phosphohydroxythreonine transaminase [Rikenellaceae bacterium]MBQ5596169.1 3-phosphoserine/phosphohydroxythreonine transaminase [Rikenellaceae bacterium]MBQ5678318.1 3-phosphoserine/phosphohydroxythreonine transaminase [Rikenellaceae bacterium]MBQ5852993.1 3-phosphoserine/phosphohydroxythreonine transaminase [Rikenellaceae bacterium]